jgi:hypothetical protein
VQQTETRKRKRKALKYSCYSTQLGGVEGREKLTPQTPTVEGSGTKRGRNKKEREERGSKGQNIALSEMPYYLVLLQYFAVLC